MNADEYQTLALRTASMATEKDFILNGVMGLCGESGECIDIVKKHIFQGHELNTKKLAEELGDVAWYLAITAHALGEDLSEILRGNIDKLMARYPEGFDAERSLHRELDSLQADAKGE